MPLCPMSSVHHLHSTVAFRILGIDKRVLHQLTNICSFSGEFRVQLVLLQAKNQVLLSMR